MRKNRFFSNLIKEIEFKWKEQVLSLPTKRSNSDAKGKSYVLAQFPYPSGSLHLGHVRVYTASDALARTRRLQGYNVLHPIGWDAFGLPAENAARERGIDPAIWTRQNIQQMKKQLADLSVLIDWDEHEINTSSQEYSKWTKWIFSRLFKKGLAYRSNALVNWDPIDQTVLADEQVSPEGNAWRSGAKVEQKELPQWFIKITQYKENLLKGIDDLEGWPIGVKEMQRNWISGMRDWLVSRQRRWGAPIPVSYCQTCGPQLTVDDEGNEIKDYSTCPNCGSTGFTPETDTLDTFVDSSWYYLRFLDPKNRTILANPENIAKWMPIDVYIGGIEHAIMHLLYSRFIYKFLIQELDLKQEVPDEPFKQLICQGLVMGKTLRCPDTQAYLKPDQVVFDANELTYTIKATGKEARLSWEKMSKSKYNGVDPTHLVESHGSDVLRLAILFKAPLKNTLYWDELDLVGIDRWFDRLLKMNIDRNDQKESSRKALARARFQVTRDLENDRYNFHTAIAALMKLSNELDIIGGFDTETLEQFSIMLYPMAPHMASELYSRCNYGKNIQEATWPSEALRIEKNKREFIKVQLDGTTIGEVEYNREDASLINNVIDKFNLSPSLCYRILPEKGILSFTSRKIKN